MTVRQISSTSDWLLMEADFPTYSPEVLYDHFITADLLKQWWVGDVPEIMPEVGGHYHFSWMPMGWHLSGTYKAAERGKVLAFSWKWEHEPLIPMRHVCLMFHAGQAENSSRLTVLHGIYSDSEADQEDRQSHVDGWTHFLGKLAMLDDAH